MILREKNKTIKRICVFCGSNSGAAPEYERAAIELGALIAEKGLGLVYGGGGRGMMGALSNSALSHGGRVKGVVPKKVFSDKLINENVKDIRMTASMHARKALMGRLSDAFIVMPGGIGTLEEFAEVFTWIQLGLHSKPLGLLNTKGYYNELISFFETSMRDGFFDRNTFSRLSVSKDPAELLGLILDKQT